MMYGRFYEEKVYDINKYNKENGYISGITNNIYSKEFSPNGCGKKNGKVW